MPRTGSILATFLKDALLNEKYINLRWINRDEAIFGLTCTHKSSKEWTENCFKIFEDWEKMKSRRGRYKQRFSDSRQRLLTAMKKSHFLHYYRKMSGGCLKVFKFSLAQDTSNILNDESRNLNSSFSSDGSESPPLSPCFFNDEIFSPSSASTLLSPFSDMQLDAVEPDVDSPENLFKDIFDIDELKSFIDIDEAKDQCSKTEILQDIQTPVENVENLPDADNWKMSSSQSDIVSDSPSVQNISAEILPNGEINGNEFITCGQVTEAVPLLMQVGDYTIIILKNS